MTRLLLIRHATNDTVGKLLAGRMTGVHLNEEGIVQAQQLAQRLAPVSLAAIYSSPLERAIETAEPLAALRAFDIRIREDFLELDLGEWTGISLIEVKKQALFQQFNSFRSNTRLPGGETMFEAQLRMVTGLQQLCMQHQNETVAVVSHGDLIKAAVAFYAGIHLDLFQRIEISPASVSIIEMYDETVRILLVNDTGGIRF